MDVKKIAVLLYLAASESPANIDNAKEVNVSGRYSITSIEGRIELNSFLTEEAVPGISDEMISPDSPRKDEIMDSIDTLVLHKNSNSFSGSQSDTSSSYSEPYGADDLVTDPDFRVSADETSDVENNMGLTNTDAESLHRTEVMDFQEKRGRKRKANTDAWLKNSAKRLRNRGQAYRSVKQIRQEDGTKKYVFIQRDKREIGPPCSDKCRLKCFEKISSEIRQSIFNDYWEMGNLQRQHDFMLSCMTPIKPRYRYEKADSCRRLNNAFYLGSD
nr:unnamed protein product [Callosobruchus analis]